MKSFNIMKLYVACQKRQTAHHAGYLKQQTHRAEAYRYKTTVHWYDYFHYTSIIGDVVTLTLFYVSLPLEVVCVWGGGLWGSYNFRNGTAERNDCVSFRILQEYDNLLNGTAGHTVIGRNGTPTLTLTK